MTEKEALTRIKTGYFGDNYEFDWQLLINVVGTIGEMFRNGQVSEVVRCKDCKYWDEADRNCNNIEVGFFTAPEDWYCADGERRNNDN